MLTSSSNIRAFQKSFLSGILLQQINQTWKDAKHKTVLGLKALLPRSPPVGSAVVRCPLPITRRTRLTRRETKEEEDGKEWGRQHKLDFIFCKCFDNMNSNDHFKVKGDLFILCVIWQNQQSISDGSFKIQPHSNL